MVWKEAVPEVLAHPRFPIFDDKICFPPGASGLSAHNQLCLTLSTRTLFAKTLANKSHTTY